MDVASTWVTSLGGPLIVVPVSALDDWHGCTQNGLVMADGDVLDDYDRACEIDDLAATIAVGQHGGQGLVLADEPARTCYLPEHRAFVRWLAAGSETELIDAATAVLRDPDVAWVDCGTWETDGPAVLLDSVTAGSEVGLPYPGGDLPEQAGIPIPAGRWRVRAVQTWTTDQTYVGLVRLSAPPG